MLKELAKELGIEVTDEMTDEEVVELIKQKNNEKDEHITTLESEKETLSRTNEELSASVEGEKADKEKLNNELSETKGKLQQISDMYKEQFEKNPEEKQEAPKTEKELKDDVLQKILDAN